MSFYPRTTDQPRPGQEQNHFKDTPGFTTHGVPYNPQATVIHTDPCGPAPFPHRRTAGPSDVGHVNIPVEGPLHTGEVGSSRCSKLPVLTSRTRVTRSGLMRPSPPTITMLPPLPKPAGREPLHAFRPAKGSVEPPQLHSPGWRRERVGRLHGSSRHLQPLLPDIFEAANPSDAGRGLPKSSRLLPGNPPGYFLLPSYPLATLPGVQRDTSPRRRDPGPWRDSTVEALQEEKPGRNLHLDLALIHDPDEEPVDKEEMMNSLRLLRKRVAKKRAKDLKCKAPGRPLLTTYLKE
ncbi:uncharacterized protein LOC143522382 [Brachyhypopomus gauderio]|uniref:uncharacterized protein LOC143522382 n=1 Tax=Brachyhypopomus gauderio TaxID=698409 RepID=UPI00404293AB